MDNDNFKDKMEDIMAKAKVFASQAGKKAGDIAQTVGEKTGEFMDAAKKKIEIEKLEYAITKKYKELGKIFYESKANNTECNSDELCTEITTLLDALAVLNSDEAEENETETAESTDETE
jgi:hypothetical protein